MLSQEAKPLVRDVVGRGGSFEQLVREWVNCDGHLTGTSSTIMASVGLPLPVLLCSCRRPVAEQFCISSAQPPSSSLLPDIVSHSVSKSLLKGMNKYDQVLNRWRQA